MKFRCTMTNTIAMRDFTNIISAIAKMSKHCVLMLSSEEICYTIVDDRHPVVWAQLPKDHFFNEYVLAGACKELNMIYLEFDAMMLSKSLTSLKAAARSVKIKLTNKQQPCLTLEIELPSQISDSWQCVHDVPIRVVPKQEWPAYKAPDIPDFNISIDLPQLKHIRNVVEKMKNMSPQLAISADNNGMLILKVETDRATVATHFQGLHIWKDNPEDEQVTATVDLKRFHMFLAWDSVHPENVQCNILHERMIYLHVTMQDNIQIHYFVPAIAI